MVSKEEKKSEDDEAGISPSTMAKLEEIGLDTYTSIATTPPQQISDSAGISLQLAKKVVSAAMGKVGLQFQSGSEMLERRNHVQRIKTGSENLNQLLGGGVETAAITEFYGAYGSSKTQMAHDLSVSVQREDQEAVAVFIDTENTFRPERIKQFAEGYGMDVSLVLKNIKVARAYNADHQVLLSEKIEGMIKKENLKVKLVVIDSLTAHFRAEFVGRGMLADRQQKLNKHMHTLMRLADNYNLAVYVTNQVMSRPDVMFGDPTESIGGNVVGHNSMFRVYLRRGKKGSRVAKLVDSPHLPESEAVFYITEGGIRDE